MDSKIIAPKHESPGFILVDEVNEVPYRRGGLRELAHAYYSKGCFIFQKQDRHPSYHGMGERGSGCLQRNLFDFVLRVNAQNP